jgi:hypothetical protein
MNKLLAALFAGTVALVAAPAFADDSDMKPLTKMQTDEAKAAKAAAKAKWAEMTPEEKAAAKKAAAAKNQANWTAVDAIARKSGITYDAKKGAADAAAAKAQPAPTKQERQQYGTTMDKKASSGQ